MKRPVTLHINGQPHRVLAEPPALLVHVGRGEAAYERAGA